MGELGDRLCDAANDMSRDLLDHLEDCGYSWDGAESSDQHQMRRPERSELEAAIDNALFAMDGTLLYFGDDGTADEAKDHALSHADTFSTGDLCHPNDVTPLVLHKICSMLQRAGGPDHGLTQRIRRQLTLRHARMTLAAFPAYDHAEFQSNVVDLVKQFEDLGSGREEPDDFDEPEIDEEAGMDGPEEPDADEPDPGMEEPEIDEEGDAEEDDLRRREEQAIDEDIARQENKAESDAEDAAIRADEDKAEE